MRKLILFTLAVMLLCSACFYTKDDVDVAYDSGYEAGASEAARVSVEDVIDNHPEEALAYIETFYHDDLLDWAAAEHADYFLNWATTENREYLLNWAAAQMEEAPAIMDEDTAAQDPAVTYVANKNTMKFHKPGCASVNDIADHNRLEWTGARDELIDRGYEPCQRCDP